MLENMNQYAFEKDWSTKPRAVAEADSERHKLVCRLGFTPTNPSTLFNTKLSDFVIQCHLAVSWYQKKIRRELWWRRVYFSLSLVLLALIPVALFLVAKYLAQDVNGTPLVMTQLAAVLTGVFAFYRGISGWLDKRQVVGNFSKAASDLKEVLYTFEQVWDGVATDPKRAADFAGAIVTATNACRAIIRREADQYFATLSYPTLDLGSLLQSSAADAGSLVSRFAVATPRQPVQATIGQSTTISDPRVSAAKVEQLRARVQALDTELLALQGTGAPEQIAAVSATRDRAVRDLRAAEINAAVTVA